MLRPDGSHGGGGAAHRLLMVRHGETPWNLEGRIQGHTDVPLSEKGRAQAASLARRIARFQVHAAYASDLTRTMHTAESALAGREVAPSPVPELREFSYGRWEGMTHWEVEREDPAAYADMMTRRPDFVPPGGESLHQVRARVCGFASGLRAAMFSGDPGGFRGHSLAGPRGGGGSVVLVVGHGGSLRALLVCLLGLPVSVVWSLWLDTASLTIVDLYPDNAVMKLFNDTSHLRGDEGP